MHCPIDGTTLQMSDRQGIEIDYCPTCRGVWLDRGELEKIIAASREDFQGGPAPQDQQRPAPQQHFYGERGEQGERGERGEQGERGYSHQQGYGQQGYNQQGRRKRGFDMFDIFD